MVVNERHVKELRDLLESCRTAGPMSMRLMEREIATGYLARRAHLLFGEGFNEARIFKKSDKAAHDVLASYLERIARGRKVREPFQGPSLMSHEAILRDEMSGEWFLLYCLWGDDYFEEPVQPLSIGLYGLKGLEAREIEVDGLLRRLEGGEQGGEAALVFPQLWVPPRISKDEIAVSSFSLSLMEAIRDGYTSLQDVKWRQLEEIVAELLRSEGLEVELTQMTRDGGRDVIAEGELFPGVYSRMAVEVTKQNVGREKLASALHWNAAYPLIMVATSGRFTSGVFEEADKPEYQYRLLLRDGDQLHRWIMAFASSSAGEGGVSAAAAR